MNLMNHGISFLGRVLRIITLLSMVVSCDMTKMTQEGLEPVPCKGQTIPQLLDENFKFPGTLLLDVPIDRSIVALNGENHTAKTIFQYPDVEWDRLSLFELSPDGKWIALLLQDQSPTSSPPYLILISNTGKAVDKQLDLFVPPPLITTNKYRWRNLGWLNEKLLRVYMDDGDTGAVLFLDPFLGQWQPHLFQIPDQEPLTGRLISPDQNHALYVNQKNNLSLYDFQKGRSLWQNESEYLTEIASHNIILLWAQWTADSKYLAAPVSIGAERFGVEILTQEGVIFRKYLLDNELIGLSWSHNQKFTANHVTDPVSNDPKIVIYNIDSQSLQQNCLLQGLASPLQNLYAKNIVWSPDDRFIIYGFRKPDGIRNGLILQNLNSGERRLIDLNKNIYLIGWSSLEW